MIIRKRKNITEESISRVRQKTRVCESYKDPDGYPCVGYMDGDEFVPNQVSLKHWFENLPKTWMDILVKETNALDCQFP